MARKRKEEQTVKVTSIIKVALIIFLLIVAQFKMGPFGLGLNKFFAYLFGDLYWIVLVTLISYFAYMIFYKRKYHMSFHLTMGLILINLGFLIIQTWSMGENLSGIEVINNFKVIEKFLTIFNGEDGLKYGGGLLGSLIYSLISHFFGSSGGVTFAVISLLAAVILIIPGSFVANAWQNYKDGAAERKELREALKEEKAMLKLKAKEEAKQIKEDKKIAKKIGKQVTSTMIDLNGKKEKEEPIWNYEGATSFEQVPLELDKKGKKQRVFVDVTPDDEEVETVETKPTKSKPVKYNKYKLPPFSTLLPYKPTTSRKVNEETAKIKGQSVVDILEKFEIPCELIDTHVGPCVTKFEIKPHSDVKVNKINNIADNIKMELAAREIRIEAPIPGRNAVGIEIPNVERETVCLSELVKLLPVDKKNSKLLFILGKDLFGKPVFCELNKMPHMLIAGSTGSGKSVCINTIITSFLLRTKPDEVKLILIDPKKVEFTPYHDIPHLLMPVITDTSEAIFALKRMCEKMDDRFSLFAEVGVRDIASYNQKVEENNADSKNEKMEKMPYIVLIIDELADLMIMGKKEVEPSIQRITQLARACGIHLIVATQRPSVDVITGIIKSNIPSRIAFAVATATDSRTILDRPGAEKLLGWGDMLYFPMGDNAPTRLQGVYVSDKEIKQVTDFCKSQDVLPQYDDAYFEFKNIGSGGQAVSGYSDGGSRMEKDALYDEVKQYVIQQQKASTSLVQRRFGVGVNRAGRIIDMLEEEGVIGPANGSKPREVYIQE